jgi:hypothetical protein
MFMSPYHAGFSWGSIRDHRQIHVNISERDTILTQPASQYKSDESILSSSIIHPSTSSLHLFTIADLAD